MMIIVVSVIIAALLALLFFRGRRGISISPKKLKRQVAYIRAFDSAETAEQCARREESLAMILASTKDDPQTAPTPQPASRPQLARRFKELARTATDAIVSIADLYAVLVNALFAIHAIVRSTTHMVNEIKEIRVAFLRSVNGERWKD
jgi:hypothetical protein